MPAITNPYQSFVTLQGDPLDGGYIYVGTANANPETNPVSVYWDLAMTQPAPQPLQTIGGYIVRDGSPATIYTAGDFSMTVKDSKGALIFYAPNSALYGQINKIYSDLADTASAGLGAGLVGYNSALSYAANTVGAAINSVAAAVSVNGIDITRAPYNADGTGVVDCATALAAAFAACPAGGTIIFPAGKTFKLSTCTFDGKAVTLYAVGSTINCISSTGAMLKTDHGNTLTVIGGRWLGTASSRILRYNATATGVQYNDLVVWGAYFKSKDNFAVDLRGCRDVSFSQCSFECDATTTVAFSGGVYLTQANNPYFAQCFFIGRGKGYGFFADGAGSPNSANPVLDSCEIIGWDIGVKIVGCDDGALISVTIDYSVTQNTYISSQDVFKIVGCYLGGGIDGVSNVPALVITSEGGAGYGPDLCRFITVSDTHFVGHQTVGNLLDLVLITGPSTSYLSSNIVFEGCHFQQYTRRAINYSLNNGPMIIGNCTWTPIGGSTEPTTTAIYNALGNGDLYCYVNGGAVPFGTTLSGANISRTRIHNLMGYGTAGYISRTGSTNPNGNLIADRGTILAQTDGLWIKGGSDGTNLGWAQPGSGGGGGGITRSYVYAHTCTQAFGSSPSALTQIIFTVEVEDALGEWNGTTFTAANGGDYHLDCVMAGTAPGNYALNEQTRVDIFRNGTRTWAGHANVSPGAFPANPQTSVHATFSLNAGDTVDVRLFNNCSGGTVTASGSQFSTWITIKRIS